MGARTVRFAGPSGRYLVDFVSPEAGKAMVVEDDSANGGCSGLRDDVAVHRPDSYIASNACSVVEPAIPAIGR